MSTDGVHSFMILRYQNPDVIRNITGANFGTVGFDAGDQTRTSTVLRGDRHEEFGEVNIYRIDGMNLL